MIFKFVQKLYVKIVENFTDFMNYNITCNIFVCITSYISYCCR